MKSIVSLVKCSNYKIDNIQNALSESLSHIKGWDKNFKTGGTVLIKPNLLSGRLPEEGVTTHPEVLRAVIRLFKGRAREIWVGDSPGGFGKNIDEVYEKTLTKKICDEEGVLLVKFEDPVKVKGIPVTKRLMECDFFVSLPKFKTHTITTITAGVKNSFGVVPGLFKPQSHSVYPTVMGFSNFLVDVFSIRLPDLVILDAIVAMEGDGPNSGTLKNLNLLACSLDAVSLDAVMAKLIGLKSFDILTTKFAHERKIGEGDLNNIEIAGGDIDNFMAKKFRLPIISPGLINPLLKALFKFVKFKPYIDKNICTSCNLCKESCPIKAIDLNKDFDYKKCILCLCCFEFCPKKAVKIKRNLMAKIVWG